VIAYISSCAIIVLVSIIAYIVHWLEDRAKREETREQTERTEQRAKLPWSKRIWMNTRSYLLLSELWKRFFERVILAWSDQQLIMGVCWLIVGGAGLPVSRGHMSVSVFIMVINLAWFAVTTHIITIFVLREYFMDPRHSVLTTVWVRPVSMIIFAVILITSTCAIRRPGFAFFNCPAKCVLLSSDPPSGFNTSATTPTSAPERSSPGELIAAPLFPVSLVVLMVSYVAAIGPMFTTTPRSFNRVLNALPSRYADWITGGTGFSTVIMRSLGSALLLVIVVVDLYLFVFDTYQTFSNIAATQNLMNDQEEKIWGFGQVLPLLLLIFPLVQAFKTYNGNITQFSFHVADLCMADEKVKPQEQNHEAIELPD
jgi:hypothetical protein